MLNYTSRQFYDAQIGMTREVLTKYGATSRLWWDHYPGGHHGAAMCPNCTDAADPYCFPTAWPNFTALVRAVSPNTLIGTGPDVSHSGGNGMSRFAPLSLSPLIFFQSLSQSRFQSLSRCLSLSLCL